MTRALSKRGTGYKELGERAKRAEKLKRAYFQLTEQRNLNTAKGSKRKVVISKANEDEANSRKHGATRNKKEEDEDKDLGRSKTREIAVYKWKRQRSR